MNIVSGYDIRLTRLTEADLPLVRQWRNDPEVRTYMVYRKHISEEEQLSWFRRIDNGNNFYFMISDKEDRKVGMINLKDVDFEAGQAEGGIFMFGQEHWESGVAVKANALMCRFAFGQLGLERLVCTVLEDNTRAMAYNKTFGYRFTCADGVCHGVLGKDGFQKFINKYDSILERL